MTPTTLRRMRPADLAGVQRLWRSVGLTDEPEDGTADLTRFLGSTQSAAFLVEAEAMIVGAVLCGSDGRYGYIHHLAVSESARGSGIGRSLVDACTAFLACRHVIVMVRETNDVARDFWKRVGYGEAEGLRLCYRRIEPR